MSGKLKIAVIGSRPFIASSPERRLDWFKWDQLSKLKNIHDYDAVVLVFPTLGDLASVEELERIFDPKAAQELLDSGTSVIFLGDPRRNIGSWAAPLLGWTGLVFTWDDRPGDTIIANDDRQYQHALPYLEALDRWSYSLAECVPDPAYWGEFHDLERLTEGEASFSADVTRYAWNRYGNALAFSVSLLVKIPSPNQYGKREEIRLDGDFVFLPTTSRSTEEDLLVLLRDFLGAEVAIPEPQWVNAMVAPGQEQLDQEMDRIAIEIERHEQLLGEKACERDQVRAPLKLLYERGEALESAVRDVLARLGARVETPEHPGKEDGWISVGLGSETLEGVLEVKGTRNDQFDEGGLRQLSEWIYRGAQEREKAYKGIFIGNSATEKPLGERPNPFSSNWRRTAILQNLAAITTEDLYAVYAANQAGLIDRESFWRQLFEASGPIDVSALVDASTAGVNV
jgi:hypothetical protein